MMRTLHKQLLEPTHVSPQRLLFKLGKGEDFITKPNGLARREVSLMEDINKGIPRTNRTNIKTIHPPFSIIFKSKGNEFHPHNIA